MNIARICTHTPKSQSILELFMNESRGWKSFRMLTKRGDVVDTEAYRKLFFVRLIS